ncbi:hypothetical protein KAR91_52155 [Candidatus Pacearchaeota archaeon]|nr:hypothetical protein [Candidatus Pacearchaeota archaeon]
MKITEGSYYCPKCKVIVNDIALNNTRMCPNCKKGYILLYSNFRMEDSKNEESK